ncbi:MAG TPA: DUF2079 domain-containing protein [Planctomycetaceae bacterium]|nr:DUF2079 domain-containing protein [Planctomycetaceae bacterium]
MPEPHPSARRHPLLRAGLVLLMAAGGAALALQSALEDVRVAGALVISRGLWTDIVAAVDGTTDRSPHGPPATADVPYVPLLGLLLTAGLAAWLAGAGLISWRARRTFGHSLAEWGWRGWRWWLLPGAWEVLRVIAGLAASIPLMRLVVATAPFWFAAALAGWLATLLSLAANPGHQAPPSAARASRRGIPAFVWLAAAAYTLVWTAMNWQLYFALNLPHGDSAMYEEHLWNLTHGKGFRSYLDQGLFLGEHVQVIHVLLIPLYLLWPSHLLLELCQSAALASGSVATFLLARRQTGSERAGCCLAAAYLLYFPLHFLDISIDIKTFRPMAFSVPLLLFALDQLERRRWKTMLLLLGLALSSKEDLAVVIAPLGVWIAATACWPGVRERSTSGARPWGAIVLGLALAVFATAYLVAVVGWVIPAFRSGETVHYSRYFQAFGETPGEIVRTMLTDPARVAREFFTADTLLYAAALVVPLGCLPLFAAGRLLVGLPLFFVLCLNELGRAPHFHFHAPLVPIVVWAAAAGLGNVTRRSTGRATEFHSGGRWASHFAWCSAFATGLFFSLGPLGIAFWDRGSGAHWRTLYVPGERAARFSEVERLIPRGARVASTDFIHPRFTHHERSYDYSEYPRAVNDNRPGAPPDTDFIVIDKQDRYRSLAPPEQQIRGPADLPEYGEDPGRWEVLVDDEYFMVLRRR